MQETIEIQGKAPSPRQIQAAIRAAREAGARTIFVQPQFDARAAQSIARAIGGEVAPLDPLARDVLKNLQTMGNTIEKALRKEGDRDGQ
jgi:zinc transport system substrate-binding protein